MAKRFIDTNIFKKGFVKLLPSNTKLFYIYLFCECDHYGIWNVELDVAEVRLGISLDYTYTLDLLGDKIIEIEKGRKWFLPQFILFQYGTLNPKHKLHRSVFNELEKRNLLKYLTVTEDLPNSSGRVKEKEMEKEMDKEMEKEKEKDLVEFADIKDLVEFVDIPVSEYYHTGETLSNRPKSAKKRTKSEGIGKKRQKQAVIDGFSSIPVSEYQNTQEIPPNPTKSAKRRGYYTELITIYSDWAKKRGISIRINSVEGKAIKDIYKYIMDLESVKSNQKTYLEIWHFILDNWDKLNSWTQTQIQLRQINSQLPNIIEQLRQHYGKGKQTQQTNTALDLANALRNKIQGGTGTEFNISND